MTAIKERYSRYPAAWPLPLVLDGSTGTSLMAYGMPQGACTELWVSEHPDTLVAIQRGYLEAGSDMLMTPTFGATRPALARHGFTGDIAALNASLTALTKRAIAESGKAALAAGDMSPTGLMLAPVGDTPFEDAVAIYREQARGLKAGGADLFYPETTISLAELRAAVTAAIEEGGLPVFATVTVDKNGRTMNGDTVLCSLLTAAALGVSAFGLNCSCGPQDMTPWLAEAAPYAQALGIPLIAKPNAGMPRPEGGYDLTEAEFAAAVPALTDAGAVILGGCCGTGRGHIEAIRRHLDTAVLPDAVPAAGLPDLSRVICNNHTVVTLPEHPELLPLNDDLEDDAEDYALVELKDADDARTLLEMTPYLPPVALADTSDPAAAALFVREYCGRTMSAAL